MKRTGLFITLCIFLGITATSFAQPGIFTRDSMLAYTPLWKGERFPDGRPKVPDDIIARMRNVSMEEAWAVLQNNGYLNQFDSGWEKTHENPVLVGRAVTATFIPERPDVNGVILDRGKQSGRVGAENSWIIDTLAPGDVLVVDLFGKVINGTFAGDNLTNSIKAKTGTGYVVDGGCRDIVGILDVPDCPVFVRGWDPSFLKDVMLMGIDVPIRIGRTAVMPGDVVLGGREGVLFIPPHLALEVVETSEVVELRDGFGHQRLKEGKYTPGQIDTKWAPEIEKDFANWLATDKKGQISPEQRQKYLDFMKTHTGRTW
jgi:4-hydroxy-4-methyl-2-oxoglutarate aldolase